MAGRLVKSGEFFARATDGTVVRILEFTDLSQGTSTQDGTTSNKTPGRKNYRTGRGSPVKRIGPTEFVIVRTGLRVFVGPIK
jgi:hypothetical protein